MPMFRVSAQSGVLPRAMIKFGWTSRTSCRPLKFRSILFIDILTLLQGRHILHDIVSLLSAKIEDVVCRLRLEIEDVGEEWHSSRRMPASASIRSLISKPPWKGTWNIASSLPQASPTIMIFGRVLIILERMPEPLQVRQGRLLPARKMSVAPRQFGQRSFSIFLHSVEFVLELTVLPHVQQRLLLISIPKFRSTGRTSGTDSGATAAGRVKG